MVLNKQFLLSLVMGCIYCIVHASDKFNPLIVAQKEYALARYNFDLHRYLENQIKLSQPSLVNTPEYAHQLLANDEAFFKEVCRAKQAVVIAKVVCEPNYIVERQKIEKARADYLKNPMSSDEMHKHIVDAANAFTNACSEKNAEMVRIERQLEDIKQQEKKITLAFKDLNDWKAHMLRCKNIDPKKVKQDESWYRKRVDKLQKRLTELKIERDNQSNQKS